MTIDEIVGDLERLIAEKADLSTILEVAMRELHESNPRFDWTGIYELLPDDVLQLGPFVGAPTDHVFISSGNGVCGTAIAEQRNINVPDVRSVENYLACSADTRSELVVLIRVGERIVGQIDIDSHSVDAFDEQTVEDVERVAEVLSRAYVARS